MGPHIRRGCLMRRPDWDARLVRVLEIEQASPFEWGAHDCATLWRAAIEAMTGRDPLAGVRPWFSERSALRVLARVGVASVSEFIDGRFPSIPVDAARRGDLVLPDLPQGPLVSPAVVLTGEALTRSSDGLIMVPAPMWRRAWRV